MKKTTNKRHVKLLLVLLVFLVPIIVSWSLYHFHAHFNFKTINRGTLANQSSQVRDLAVAAKRPVWQIVYLPDQCCDEHCQKTMFTLHQLRKALGNDRDRVSLTLVIPEQCASVDAHDFRKVVYSSTQYSPWQSVVHEQEKARDKIYIVDPLTNVVIYYPTSTNPMDILKDLKRLLEVSQIG